MPKNKPSEETLAQARRVIDALNERGARKQAIRLQVTRPDAPLPQTASKFGGRPYLPAGESAPTNEKGEPLGMIAQINCAELPAVSYTHLVIAPQKQAPPQTTRERQRQKYTPPPSQTVSTASLTPQKKIVVGSKTITVSLTRSLDFISSQGKVETL